MARDFKVRPTFNGSQLALVSESNLVAPFHFAGALQTGVGKFRWYNDTGATLTIVAVRVSLNTAGTSNTILDINKDGTTIYTTQGNRPTLGSGANTVKSTNPDVTTIADGSYLSVDVDTVGTGSPADCSVTITVRR